MILHIICIEVITIFLICYDSFLWLIANLLYLLSNHFIFAMLASHLTRLSNKFVFYATHFFFYFRSVGHASRTYFWSICKAFDPSGANKFDINWKCIKRSFQHGIKEENPGPNRMIDVPKPPFDPLSISLETYCCCEFDILQVDQNWVFDTL